MLTLVDWQWKVHSYDYGPLEPNGGFSPPLWVVCLRRGLAMGQWADPRYRVHANE
jgi:hypothetical protein